MRQTVHPLKDHLHEWKGKLETQRNSALSIEELAGHPIEREAGIWEMDFDGLEKEIWTRFENLEYNSGCLKKISPPEELGWKDRLIEFSRNAWRNIKNPFLSLCLQKYFRDNIDRQNQAVRETVPYNLAVILTLQKVKDRLNRLEEQIQKTQQEQQDIYEEFLKMGFPGKDGEKPE